MFKLHEQNLVTTQSACAESRSWTCTKGNVCVLLPGYSILTLVVYVCLQVRQVGVVLLQLVLQ